MMIGTSTRTKVCQILGQDSQNFTPFKERPPPGVSVVRVETDKSSDDYVTRSCVALKYGPKLMKPLRKEKNKNERTRSRNSIMLDE